jgi:hypothetical protein
MVGSVGQKVVTANPVGDAGHTIGNEQAPWFGSEDRVVELVADRQARVTLAKKSWFRSWLLFSRRVPASIHLPYVQPATLHGYWSSDRGPLPAITS